MYLFYSSLGYIPIDLCFLSFSFFCYSVVESEKSRAFCTQLKMNSKYCFENSYNIFCEAEI